MANVEKDIRTGAWKLEINGQTAIGDSYAEARENFCEPLNDDEINELDNTNVSPGDCSTW